MQIEFQWDEKQVDVNLDILNKSYDNIENKYSLTELNRENRPVTFSENTSAFLKYKFGLTESW